MGVARGVAVGVAAGSPPLLAGASGARGAPGAGGCPSSRGLVLATGFVGCCRFFFFLAVVLQCCFCCWLTAAFTHCLRTAPLGAPPSDASARRIANQLTSS